MHPVDAQPAPLPRPRGNVARWGLAPAAWLSAACGWQPLALIALGALLLLDAYQVERPFTVNVGGPHETPFTHNFHPKETAEDGRTSYRWTHATSFLLLKGIGGERERAITLRLRSGRPPGVEQPVTVLVNGVEAARLGVGADWQTVRLDLRGAAAAGHGVAVELRTAAQKLPDSGGKVVGVQIDRLGLETPGGGRTVPAWDTFGALLLAIAILYLIILRALGFARGADARVRSHAALGGALGGVLLAGAFAIIRPYVAAYAVGLCGFLLAILAVLFLPTPLIRLGSRIGLAVTRPEAAALCAILALGLAVKLGGLLYPDTMVIDLTWHEKWQRTLLRGDFAALYFPSELSSGPGEWGAGVKIPKSPLYYVAMAPVALLPITIGAGLKLVAGLLDLALIPFAYAFLKRIDRGTAGVVAALLYTVTPLSYLILSYGSYPTLFAQFLSVLAFAVILLAGRRLDRPAVFGAFVALLTLSLLAYPVVAVFNVCLVSAFGLWRWRGAADRGDARRAMLLPAGAALAALLAFVAYYLQHVRVALASVGTLTGETARERAGADAGLLAAPGHIAAVALRNVTTGHLAVLLVLAVAGAILLRRGGGGDETRRTWQFLLLWLLIMPVFVAVDAYVELLLKPLFYTMLPVAIFGGITVVWLWRRGRAGQVIAVLCCAAIAAQGWWLWFQRIAYAGQPPN